MAINRKEVLRTDTFEQQRIKINEVAQDLFNISTGVTPIDRLLIDGALQPGSILDSEGSSGEDGQFLKKTKDGKLLWKSLTIENVLFVSKDGDDSNDGLSTETAKASIGSALRAAQRGYFGKLCDGANNILLNKKLLQDEVFGELLTEYKDYARGNRWIDAYDDIIANKEFIAAESVARMLDANPGFVIPNGNQNCIDDVKLFVDAVSFNVKYDGNNRVYDYADYYVNFTTTIEGERDRSIEVYQNAAYLMMAVMRHDPNLSSEIIGSHGLVPVYKNGVILDPLQATSQRALDAYTSIEKNKNLIAYEAYARMEDELNWIPPTGTTAQDCINDILTIIDQVKYDLAYGGNSKIYDAAELYINNTYIDDGQRDAAVNAWIKAQYLIFDIIRQRDISSEIIGTHGYTQYINTSIILDPLEAVSQLHLDAYRLIDINTQFIAAEAYDLMLDQFPGFTPTAGTVNDCLDDVYDVIDAVKYNLIYGGNNQVYDAADIYINDPSLANEDREEASVVFDKVKDLCIDVMRNIEIVSIGGPTNTYTQYIDSNVITDTSNPTCQDVAASLGTLFDIIIDAIWDGIGNAPGTITAVRTEPTPATVFGGGCSDINFTVANLFTILIQAIGTDATGVGDLDGITRTTPPVATQYGKGCNDVASAIWSLSEIYFQAIGTDATGVGDLSGITRTSNNRFVFPNSPAESGRWKDSRNLIYQNMDEIKDRSLAEIALQYPDFNFTFVDDPELQRYKDAANLILANKEEIQDKALASIAVAYDESQWGTDWVIPGNSLPGRGRYYDSYRLIQLNRQEIINAAYATVASNPPVPAPPNLENKCKRDIGYFIDAISLDIFLGSNIYSRKFTQQYFDSSTGLLNAYLAGEVSQSVIAFEEARDQMYLAITNQLSVQDLTLTDSGDDSNVAYTSADCADVQSAIDTLVLIVTSNLTTGDGGGTISLPPLDLREVEIGGSVCRRDIGYLVDAIARDVRWQTNRHSINFIEKYFDGSGVIHLSGEEVQSIIAFESARDQMYLAITNNLYSKDLTLTPDPLTGSNTDPASCADVQSNISDLISIVTQPLTDGNLNSLPLLDLGNYPGSKFSRYQDSYRLIQQNKQEIIDRSAAELALQYPDFTYPGDPASDSASRYKDSYRLIQLNRQEIIDRAGAEISIQYPDFYYPGDPAQDSSYRFKDSYRLIQQNRQEIIDGAYAEIAIQHPTFVNPDPVKCQRDIGYFIDAISLDLHNNSNIYSIKFLRQYFNAVGDSLITNGLVGELTESITAFNKASDLMKLAIANQLTVKDLTLIDSGDDSNPAYTSGDCINVQIAIENLSDLITFYLNQQSLITPVPLPSENLGGTLLEGEAKCKRDIGYFVDYLSLDISLGGTIKYIRKFAQTYFDADGNWLAYLDGEEVPSITAFNMARDMMKKAVANQLYEKDLTLTPDPLTGSNTDPASCADVQSTIDLLAEVATDVISAKSLDNLAQEVNYPNGRYQDASNLIFANKNEIADRALAEIAIQHPDFVFPNDPATNVENYRFYDGYRLIQQNRAEIIEEAWSNTASYITNEGLPFLPVNVETKCRRDIGYYIDAVSLDVFTRGNRYSREFTLQYFDKFGTPSTEVSGDQKQASLFAFNFASEKMKQAVSNQLTIQDLTVPEGPAIFGSGDPNEIITSINSCSDVQTTIDNLTTIITDVISSGDVDLLPYINNGLYNTGIGKCKRDIGYLIDGVIEDLFKEKNTASKAVANGYFPNGVFSYLIGEGLESITAFNKAADLMELAVTNNLFKQDLTIASDPISGNNKDINNCADVRLTINTLVDITVNAIESELSVPGTGANTIALIEDNYGIPAPGESKCRRDIEYFVDAVSLDIFLGAGNRYSRKLAQSYFITNDVPLYPGLLGEESQSVTAFNMARDMMQKAVTNQLFEKDLTISAGEAEYNDGNGIIPILESGNSAACVDVQNSIASLTSIITDCLTQGNLNSLPIETEYQQDRYDDAAYLIGLNKNEIQDRALAEIAIQHPDFFFKGDTQSTENSRFFDSYRLIQQNKNSIIDDAFSAAVENPLFIGFDFPSVEAKCKRDIGYFIDAISLDVFGQSNRYIRLFTEYYFDANGDPITLDTTESVFTFRAASELMKAVITNQNSYDFTPNLTSGAVYASADLSSYIKDLTLTPDPATQSNTDERSCANVRTTIDNLTLIATQALNSGNLNNIPSLNPGVFLNVDSDYTPGGKKCRRDIGYFIDTIIKDLKNRSNTNSIDFTNFYFPQGTFLYIDTEAQETITAFNKARDMMQLAITNQLYKRDLSITPDNLTGSNTDPASCSDVQSEIDSLTAIITTVLDDGNQTSLQSVSKLRGTPQPTEVKCRRDIGYVTRAIAEDLYCGGNIHSINVARGYFDVNGNPLANAIVGEESQSVIAYKTAAKYAKKALTNQLFGKDLELFRGPEEYGLNFAPRDYTKSGSDKVCIDVQNAVDNLITIIEKVVSDGSLNYLDTIKENRGRTGWKKSESLCYRDSGYVIVGIATDLKVGGNVNTTDIANFYFDNKTSELIYIDGELEQSILAYRVARDLMKKAANQWIVSPANDIYEPKYSFEPLYFDNEVIIDYEYPYCQDVANSIDNYWNIIEYMLIEGGKNSVPFQLPSFKTTVFVKSGVYTEQTPITLPPNTGIFGDNLRDVSIYPDDPTKNFIYCENGGYITNVTFSGHLAPSYTCSFPKVKIGENFTKIGSGTKGSYEITLNDTQGIKERMYVLGNGVATAAVVQKIQDKTITLSTANSANINAEELTFEYYIGTAGNITRSPYVHNCTSLTSSGSGLIVDGNLAEGTASFVLDSYTQYNQGGDGIVIVNGGYTQLVSIFEICCNRAVYLTAGSTCSITNSNTDFGNYGLVADGVGPLQYTCKVDGTQGPGAEFTLKDLPREPYVGQGITIGNNGRPYFFIQQINIINGGSGYTSPPGVVIDDPTGPSGIPAQAIANIDNGSVTSITIVSSGSQFIDPPNITLVGGGFTEQATVEPEMYPQYYSILTSTDVVDGKATITTDENIAFTLNDGDEVYFYQLTKIIANSHCMEYVGAGTKIQEAIPARGGVPIQTREVVELNGGKVAFTSTDHLGNFRIGQGLQINQNTGTLSGDSFQRSLFVTVTPFILALS